MGSHLQRVVLAFVVAGLSVSGCARDPAPGTPAAAAEGERLMRHMSATLAGTTAFRFTTAEILDIALPSGDRREVRLARTVTVRRPNAMSFELHGSSGTALDVAAFYDGRTVSLRGDANKVWARTSVPGNLDDMLDDIARRYGLPVSIADVIYASPYDAFIGRTTKGGFVGRETIEGVACAQLAYSDAFVDVRVWIPSSGQPLPRRVELGYKQGTGVVKTRIDYTKWDLQPQIADSMFSFQPDPAFTQIDIAQFAASLTSGAQPSAPAAPVVPAASNPAKR